MSMSRKSRRKCFADGGAIKETPEQLMARMAATYGGATAPSPQPSSEPKPEPTQIAQKQPGGLLDQTIGLLKGRKNQIDQASGYAHGGKISGPGTSTSDSIPAQVRETGEQIQVSTGERILSKAQDSLMQKIAKGAGFDSLDDLLEKGTGKPVGPTIKGGKAHAATGARPEDLTSPTGIAAAYPSTAQALRDTNQDIAKARESGNYGAMIGQSLRGVVPAAAGVLNDTARSAATLLDPAANALKTIVTGSNEPARPTAPVLAQTPSSPVQGAPAVAPTPTPAALPPAASRPIAAAVKMPQGIGDLAPGAGMIRNNNTAQMTAIGAAPADQEKKAEIPAAATTTAPLQGFAPSVTVAASPGTAARSAADKAIREHSRLLSDPNGGIGAGIVARGMLNKAKALEDIDAAQSHADTASQHAGIAAREGQSRDTERQVRQNEIQRRAGQEQKVNDLRDQHAALDEKTDPDGKERAKLKSKLEMLTGVDKDKYAPLYESDTMGQKIFAGAFDTRSGQSLDISGRPRQQAQATAPQAAIDYLMKNPGQAAAFKQKYGYLPQ